MPKSLSVILPAYNEVASLALAVEEIHRFCRRAVQEYEIIIVDDGSTDGTNQLAQGLVDEHVKLITHSRNLGMGASMRDGYDAAVHDYLVALPADRQLRAESLASFLPHIAEDTVVIGRYPAPHSGARRAAMSMAFRKLVVHVGHLTVDVTGAYLFPRRLYQKSTPANHLTSDTFLYSFQLLESFKRRGARFVSVEQIPVRRESGKSRVARLDRILKIFRDIIRYRQK